MDGARLNRAARAAFGGRALVDVRRLAGGTRKGVHRLTFADGGSAVAYVWTPEENRWPERHDEADPADPFTASAGPEPYLAAHRRLAALGLRTPEIFLVDGDVAIVEDFPGDTLMGRLAADPAAAEPTVRQLAGDLATMRAARGPAYGKVSFVDGGGTPRESSAEGDALRYGRRMLAEAAARDPRIAVHAASIADRLSELCAAVRPRAEYSVVHGELGLDHVLVAPDGRPVLADTEDLMYFDVEWEHVFLRIRLGDDYRRLAVDDLDEGRFAFYLLVQRLSLTAGPLRLLATGRAPDPAFMRRIAEINGAEAVRLCTGRTTRTATAPRRPSA